MPELIIERICEQAERLDVFVSAAADITRSRAGSLIKDGCVTADSAADKDICVSCTIGNIDTD